MGYAVPWRWEKWAMQREFTAVIRKKRGWYAAYIEEIPGVNTQGRTLKEARENLKDALRLILEVNRDLARKQAGGRVRREPLVVKLPA